MHYDVVLVYGFEVEFKTLHVAIGVETRGDTII